MSSQSTLRESLSKIHSEAVARPSCRSRERFSRARCRPSPTSTVKNPETAAPTQQAPETAGAVLSGGIDPARVTAMRDGAAVRNIAENTGSGFEADIAEASETPHKRK